MGYCLLPAALLLLALTCPAQENLKTRQNHLVDGIAPSLQPGQFAKIISGHKVRSVQKVSPPGRDGADPYIEFDRKGRMVWYGSRLAPLQGARYTYDDKDRIITTYSANSRGQWNSRSSMTYDSVYENVVTRVSSLDSGGRLIGVFNSTHVSKTGDTALYITKDILSSGPRGEESQTFIKREISVHDTLYVFTYLSEPNLEKGEEDKLTYQMYTNGILRQEGGVTLDPHPCDSCCPPASVPFAFIDDYIKDREARFDALLKKAPPEYVEYLKEEADKRKKKGKGKIGLDVTTCYRYGADGRMTDKLQFGGRYILHYTYNAKGQLTRVDQTPGRISVEFRYDDRGLLSGYKDSHMEVKLEYTFY